MFTKIYISIYIYIFFIAIVHLNNAVTLAAVYNILSVTMSSAINSRNLVDLVSDTIGQSMMSGLKGVSKSTINCYRDRLLYIQSYKVH